MAALTSNDIFNVGLDSAKAYIVLALSTVYSGAFVGLESVTGNVVPLDGASDRAFIGIAQQTVVGDGTKTCLVAIDGFDLKNTLVTGTTAETDNGSLVYLSTDNRSDLTLTRPAVDAVPVGFVRKYTTTGFADVRIFSADEFSKLSGRGQEIRPLGTIQLVSGTGNLLTSYPLQGHGKIVDFFGIADGLGAGAGADADLNLEIGGVNVTGGVMNILLAASSVAGSNLTSTAITADNIYFHGDLLDVEEVENTAHTAGAVSLFMIVEPLL